LAHVAGDETERAYRRSDALEKRRSLMGAWASSCEPARAQRKIVELARAPRGKGLAAIDGGNAQI